MHFETRLQVTQASNGFELLILLPPHPECWNDRHVILCPVFFFCDAGDLCVLQANTLPLELEMHLCNPSKHAECSHCGILENVVYCTMNENSLGEKLCLKRLADRNHNTVVRLECCRSGDQLSYLALVPASEQPGLAQLWVRANIL